MSEHHHDGMDMHQKLSKRGLLLYGSWLFFPAIAATLPLYLHAEYNAASSLEFIIPMLGFFGIVVSRFLLGNRCPHVNNLKKNSRDPHS